MNWPNCRSAEVGWREQTDSIEELMILAPSLRHSKRQGPREDLYVMSSKNTILTVDHLELVRPERHDRRLIVELHIHNLGP